MAVAHEMSPSESPHDPVWLDRFHAGDRAVLEQCYRDHFVNALGAAARILSGIDAETVTHEIFYRLLSDQGTRRAFGGGNLRAWLSKIVTNAAIDHHRRRRREVAGDSEDETPEEDSSGRLEEELEAKLLIERFCRECLPDKWRGVFDARFMRQLPQRDAARELGLLRSTLAYQEQQIRGLLTEFLLASEEP